MSKEKISKRELILDTAFELFLKKGYLETKMINIADAAGIGKGTIYEYFDSKEKLFYELYRCKVANNYKEITNIANKDISCENKIKEYIDFEYLMISKLGHHKLIFPEILMKTGAFQNIDLIKAIHELIEFKFSMMCQIINEGISKKEFIKIDPLLAATAIIGAVNFSLNYNSDFININENIFNKKNLSLDKEELFRLIFQGLKAVN